ncbi:hypothetical protein [Microbacterium sp. Yaish 1]|uniref:hypothetical protein n=1 Tax=Microbacterium sp. Yaish 1 TaxID=2025014 RepID=UPI000B945357|nr:hypothetical protein [Microbacterium sp. Yaish 1]OYC97923.1 hypothetical protein CI089_05200 [Microbacterium sp. Yaish 1]
MALGLATSCAALTGCASSDPPPSGVALYWQAESLYFDFRETTNGVLAVIDEGPWEVRTYGMTPSGAGCDDGWKFDLTRTTTIDPTDVEGKREAVAQHLVSEGFDVDGMDLAPGEVASTDVIVREQGVYTLLTVTLVDNGNVVVTATSPCKPGDKFELSRMLFGTGPLPEGYLPDRESPADPVFFGTDLGER